jgi:hypothetical protein
MRSHIVTADAEDVRYPGSKNQAGVADWIVGMMPTHVYYAEPFAGKGAVYRAKPPALRTWLIDQDPDVIDWWSATRGPIVSRGDGIRWCELAAEWAPPDLLIYCDPPYLLSTRSKRRIYRHELTDDDHRRLLTALRGCRCPVLISGYRSDLYDDQLHGWRRAERDVMTRGGVLRRECVWQNDRSRAQPAVTMEYSQLGIDYRERQRVARKIARWKRMLRKMPAAERRAMLLALIDDSQRHPRR